MIVAKEISPRITVDPKVCSGRPVVAGTRIHVEVVLGALASGFSMEEMFEEYHLTREDVQACLVYAAQLAQDVEVRIPS